VATGDTVDEIEREMREAVAFRLEGLEHDGAPLPQPAGPCVYVERRSRAAA
jgi:predicted RNase H-like HicB family nuclease